MKISCLAAIASASLCLLPSVARAGDHNYVGSMCTPHSRSPWLETFQWDNNASNMSPTTDLGMSCPIVNRNDEAHNVAVDVQVWDVHPTKDVSCRVTWRSTGSINLGPLRSNNPAGLGRKHICLDASVGDGAAYAVNCWVPNMSNTPSNVEKYEVWEDQSCPG